MTEKSNAWSHGLAKGLARQYTKPTIHPPATTIGIHQRPQISGSQRSSGLHVAKFSTQEAGHKFLGTVIRETAFLSVGFGPMVEGHSFMDGTVAMFVHGANKGVVQRIDKALEKWGASSCSL